MLHGVPGIFEHFWEGALGSVDLQKFVGVYH